jgi:hypothetical protein
MPDPKLGRAIALKDGTTLHTIGDASGFIEKHSRGGVQNSLKYLLLTFLKAAESGSHKDISDATEQLESVVHYAGWLRGGERDLRTRGREPTVRSSALSASSAIERRECTVPMSLPSMPRGSAVGYSGLDWS